SRTITSRAVLMMAMPRTIQTVVAVNVNSWRGLALLNCRGEGVGAIVAKSAAGWSIGARQNSVHFRAAASRCGAGPCSLDFPVPVSRME
ncbi:MAG TPA: hypothetical protein VFG08_09650, partial [Candidatus Polarisedimenticolia bacterium]|nr:hypothetical protein [Candidatus Polarisedimenticolia bacterium]